MPKVSIVLPTYNGEKYLRQSIDSIIGQTFTDWELILVDDCSTDETASIIDQYAISDTRIRVIHNGVNQKLPKSLNIGFASARGQYLTWTSDDNMYRPNAVEVMTEYLDMEQDTYMVCSDMSIIDETGKIIGKSDGYSDDIILAHNCVGACFMYRKEVRDIIGDYDTDTFCVEDYDYWLRVYKQFGKIAFINKDLYLYRQHEGSLTSTKKAKIRDQLTRLRLRYLDDILESLCNAKDQLYIVYYQMSQSPYMTEEVRERFKIILPELQGEVPIRDDRRYIIFGAGVYGERATKMLGSKAAFFTDNDPKKVRTVKCGLSILPFSEAVGMTEEYCFIVAIHRSRLYELIVQLQSAGVREYSVYVQE